MNRTINVIFSAAVVLAASTAPAFAGTTSFDGPTTVAVRLSSVVRHVASAPHAASPQVLEPRPLAVHSSLGGIGKGNPPMPEEKHHSLGGVGKQPNP